MMIRLPMRSRRRPPIWLQSSSARQSQWTRALNRAESLIAGEDDARRFRSNLAPRWITAATAAVSGNTDSALRQFFYTPSLSFSSVAATTPAKNADSDLGHRNQSIGKHQNHLHGNSSIGTNLPGNRLKTEQIDWENVLGTRNLSFLSQHIRSLATSRHPVLHRVAQYYLNGEGKKIRPLLVLLVAHATSGLASDTKRLLSDKDMNLDADSGTDRNSAPFILPTQVTLAMITELIHTASLLHDDVIDQATTRRGLPAAHQQFGNKMAILAGDYLLSRASVTLARLGNIKVVELLAEVVGDLVEGEVMQAQGNGGGDQLGLNSDDQHDVYTHEDMGRAVDETLHVPDDALFPPVGSLSAVERQPWHRAYFETYLRKTYLKTASLMAKSCRAAAVLHEADLPEPVLNACFAYGQHLGIAFQLVDDALDFTASSEQVGKPSGGNDLQLGLATAPVLYASMFYPDQLRPLIDRQFTQSRSSILKQCMSLTDTLTDTAAASVDDVQAALTMVQECQGVELTNQLAKWHSQQAVNAILTHLPPSPACEMLVDLAERVCSRKK